MHIHHQHVMEGGGEGKSKGERRYKRQFGVGGKGVQNVGGIRVLDRWVTPPNVSTQSLTLVGRVIIFESG